MKLSEYFETTTGRGILATSDASGIVDAAVYGRPHFADEKSVAFIMSDRLSHKNLQSNPHAVYLFMETGEKFVGKRLYLTKVREETDPTVIESVRRKKSYETPEEYKKETKYLAYFSIDKVLPLVGDKE